MGAPVPPVALASAGIAARSLGSATAARRLSSSRHRWSACSAALSLNCSSRSRTVRGSIQPGSSTASKSW